MIKIVNNKLELNDGTFYDLSNTKRVLQGLVSQLQDESLTQDEFNQCIKLLNGKGKEEISVTKDVCINSESYGKHIVTINSKNYDLMKALYGEIQEEGAYIYTIIL